MRIRLKDRHTGAEQVYSITSNEDFTPLIMVYPSVREVVFYQYEQRGFGDYYKHFRGLVDAVADHLNKNYQVIATVEADNIFEYKNAQDPFEKTETNKAKLALIAASIAFAPVNLQPATLTKAISPDIFKYRPYGHKTEDKFLQAIMQLESAGGKNQNHPEKNCMGRWGLMRDTIKDMIKNFDYKNEDTKILLSMDAESMKKLFRKRPELELHIARIMARNVLAKFNGDLDKSAYAWKHGQNSTPSKDDLDKSPYVQKFRFLTGKITKSEEESFEDRLKRWVLKRKKEMDNPDLLVPQLAYIDQPKDDLPQLKTSFDKLKYNIESN